MACSQAAELIRDSALTVLSKLPPAVLDPPSLYDLACLVTAAGRHEEALQLLTAAVRDEPELADHAQKDPDLDPLRGLIDFQAIFS
jgi:hypothetical protein